MQVEPSRITISEGQADCMWRDDSLSTKSRTRAFEGTRGRETGSRKEVSRVGHELLQAPFPIFLSTDNRG